MTHRFILVTMALILSVAVAPADDKKPAAKSADAASTKTLTGSVGDSMCGKSHMMPGKTAAECAKECAKDGDYALVVSDKVYTLKGHKDDLEKLAGQNATVTGKVTGTTVEVETVTAAKGAPAKAATPKPPSKKGS